MQVSRQLISSWELETGTYLIGGDLRTKTALGSHVFFSLKCILFWSFRNNGSQGGKTHSLGSNLDMVYTDAWIAVKNWCIKGHSCKNLNCESIADIQSELWVFMLAGTSLMMSGWPRRSWRELLKSNMGEKKRYGVLFFLFKGVSLFLIVIVLLGLSCDT